MENYGVPLGIQDMPSSFYAARNFDMANAKPGDERYLQAFMGDEIFALKIRIWIRRLLKVKWTTTIILVCLILSGFG